MNPTEHAIQIRGLAKQFRTGLRRKRSIALRGLDLTVSPGQVFGFLGPNGAGKTTTIKILVGLLRPDAGEARLFGRIHSDPAARDRIAYLPELPDFYEYLRPAEFLIHCGRLAGLERAALLQKVPELLARVGLDPAERRQMRKFSKGMLQRCGIAQTMLTDPDLYILDEPMGGLDPLGRRWVKDWILELRERGKTVFFSSHVLAEAEAVCDQVAFLDRGQLIAQGSMDEILGRDLGSWEILVVGEQVRADARIGQQLAGQRQAGPDSLLELASGQAPEPLVAQLAELGYQLRQVQRKHASLEDVFIRLVEQRDAERA
jgi:ABC-2 type transport system ATP-binding protein